MTTNYKIYPANGWIDNSIVVELTGKRHFVVVSYSITRKGDNISPTITYTPPNIEETLIYHIDEYGNIIDHIPAKVYKRKMSVQKVIDQYLKELE